jgi:PGF-CTERM protein
MLIQNMGATTVAQDVSHNVPSAGNDFFRWANVSTTTSGTRTVGFDTNNFTKAQKYTIIVEQIIDGQYKSDQVDVKVEKGAVTIVAAGDQSYYLGEEVKFSGTNTESYNTYLFIIGPNLAPNGAQIDDPRTAVPDNGAGMEMADVASDNTWSYKWGTSTLQLDAGTYTVYAVSQPVNKGQLSSVAYGTVSVIIKKPFVSATASQSTVAQGDRLYITGTAEGQPSAGVAIWIMGKNYASRDTVSVESDSTFKYEVKQAATQDLYPGQYFVVVQHPMQNDAFDITTNPGWSGGQITSPPLATGQSVWVVNKQLGNQTLTPAGTNIFLLYGAGALQGSDAAEALVQAINDPNVDDTYTKLQFLVETGVINIVPIGDKHVGDKFTIKALTNLAVDDEILVQVYSSSFKPTQKSQSGEFSGATGTVKVTKGDSGMNTISFDVDASTFKPDEYIVTEEAVIQGTTGSALFNVLEGAAPTAVPTPVPTTAVPTTVATPVPTTMKPTPTPTKSPGYGALIALIGLGAVAFIVVRRH